MALDADGAAGGGVDGHLPGAGVGAVVGAYAGDDGHGRSGDKRLEIGRFVPMRGGWEVDLGGERLGIWTILDMVNGQIERSARVCNYWQ